MSEQCVKPQPPSALAWLATNKAKRGGHYTAGEVENFREGWVLPLGSFGKAHYLTLLHGMHWAPCGAGWSAGRVFAAGNWPKCKSCLRHRPGELLSGWRGSE